MEKTSGAFTDIDTWVFDLDNTLYPHHVNLWQQVDVRIGEFVGAWLKVSPEEARRIQKDYYRRYGTTMRGMMTEHGVRADDYLAYVHQIDHSPLQPNPAMGAAIAKLPGRKLILTNGSTDHADKVLQRLGIGAHFEAVFDIIARRTGAEAGAADLSEIPWDAWRQSQDVGNVRGSGAQPRGAAPARHDHGAGGARRHKAGRARGLGAGRPRRGPCRSCNRRSDRIFGGADANLIVHRHARPCRLR
jgi:pyrimidine 5'-nucleotidase